MMNAEPETRRRVRISASMREIVEDVLSRWSDSTSEETASWVGQFTARATYIEGPSGLMAELGEQIEAEAWDAGDAALAGVFDDNPARQKFTLVQATASRILLGRRLQGVNAKRQLIWREVTKECEKL